MFDADVVGLMTIVALVENLVHTHLYSFVTLFKITLTRAVSFWIATGITIRQRLAIEASQLGLVRTNGNTVGLKIGSESMVVICKHDSHDSQRQVGQDLRTIGLDVAVVVNEMMVLLFAADDDGGSNRDLGLTSGSNSVNDVSRQVIQGAKENAFIPDTHLVGFAITLGLATAGLSQPQTSL